MERQFSIVVGHHGFNLVHEDDLVVPVEFAHLGDVHYATVLDPNAHASGDSSGCIRVMDWQGNPALYALGTQVTVRCGHTIDEELWIS